jgi:hypothetical protein
MLSCNCHACEWRRRVGLKELDEHYYYYVLEDDYVAFGSASHTETLRWEEEKKADKDFWRD